MLIHEDIATFIARERLLTAGQRVVVAVSGGPDSLCLFDCLHRLGYDLRVAHLDHGLRRASWRDAEFVLALARQRGIPATAQRLTPRAWRRKGLSIEEAARLARYRFLATAAREWGAQTIATGHTADDQAETVLMHFLRGAGVHGLRGMLPCTALRAWAEVPEAEGLTLIRPLLTAWRTQTENHCHAAGLRPRRDPTNADPAFFRNRLRHALIPELERYNPRVRQVLARTGEVLRAESEQLDEIVEAAEPTALRFREDGTVAIDRHPFLVQPLAVQRALILRAAHRLAPGMRDFSFRSVELARARLGERSVGRRTALPGGLELLDEGDGLLLVPTAIEARYAGYPQLTTPEAALVRLSARLPLRDGALIVSNGRAPSASQRRSPPGLTEPLWLDKARLESELVVRPPRPGDRMRPLGMQGHRKLSDIFNSQRIPAGARRRWPVVISGDRVVCLAGLRIDNDVRLTSTTRDAVQLRVELTEGASE